MAESLSDKVSQGIDLAGGLYHRLILLVAPPGSGKTAVLQDVAQRKGLLVINLNLELCKRMLEWTVRQRMLQLPRLLSDIVQTTHTDGVLFDNIIVGEYGQPHTWKIHKHRGIGQIPDNPEARPNKNDQTAKSIAKFSGFL